MKLKQPLKKAVGLLTGLAFVLILTQTTGNSMAYFTTYAIAKGGHTIHYTADVSTKLHEEFRDWVKYVTVENIGTEDCFVRVRGFAGSRFTLEYSDENEKWVDGGDGWWYYTDLLKPEEVTERLSISITVPEDLAESFNVAVVQEFSPVRYRDDGTPYADWNKGKGA